MRYLIFLLLLSPFALTQINTPAKPVNAHESTHHEAQPAHPQSKSQRSVGIKESKEPDIQVEQAPPDKKNDVSKSDESNYTFWALIVNGALTLITLAIAIAGIIQALAAKESSDIAMNAQRSWIVE